MEPFWVPCRTISTKVSTWNPKGFYLDPKRVLQWGQPRHLLGTPFFLRLNSSVLSKNTITHRVQPMRPMVDWATCHWLCLCDIVIEMTNGHLQTVVGWPSLWLNLCYTPHTHGSGLKQRRQLYHVRYRVEMYYILSLHPNITLYIHHRRPKYNKQKIDKETQDFHLDI